MTDQEDRADILKDLDVSDGEDSSGSEEDIVAMAT